MKWLFSTGVGSAGSAVSVGIIGVSEFNSLSLIAYLLARNQELHQVGESKISHPQIDRDDQRYQNHDGSLPYCALAGRPLNTFKFGLDVNKKLPDSIEHGLVWIGRDDESARTETGRESWLGTVQARQGSNLRPADLESAALPAELLACTR